MRTEGHRSQIGPRFSMHAAIEAALVKLSFVIKNHTNACRKYLFPSADVYSVKLKRKRNLFQLLKNRKEVEGSRTKCVRL